MSKKYVEVTATFNEHGRIRPLYIKWDDGRTYEIDKIVDVRRAVTLKAGGCGLRYTCMIMGRQSYLYYEDDGKWFVDAKN